MTPTIAATEGVTRIQSRDEPWRDVYDLPVVHDRPKHSSFTDTLSSALQGTADGGALLRSLKWAAVCLNDARLLVNRVSIVESPRVGDEMALRQALAQVESPPHNPLMEALAWIKGATDFSDERIGALLGVKRQSLSLWRQGYRITGEHRRRLLAVYDILRRVGSRFGSGEPLATWLDTPTNASGVTPALLLASNEIDRVRYLAVSGPVSPLLVSPSAVAKPIAPGLRRHSEPRQPALAHDDYELSLQIGRFLDSEGADEG